MSGGAVITGGLTQDLPLKFFYYGPMFRFERPQEGPCLRQFHQIGVELFGANEPLGDVEVIAIGAHLLDELGHPHPHDARAEHAGRPRQPHGLSRRAGRLPRRHAADRLSKDSLDRLVRNPLRVLDSKDEGDRAVVAEAPLLGEHLNAASRETSSAGSGPPRPARHRVHRATSVSSAASTTTTTPPSSSRRRRWAAGCRDRRRSL